MQISTLHFVDGADLHLNAATREKAAAKSMAFLRE
jgi:hypothetical protein